VELDSADGSSLSSMKWIVTLEEDGYPLFGKQIKKQIRTCITYILAN